MAERQNTNHTEDKSARSDDVREKSKFIFDWQSKKLFRKKRNKQNYPNFSETGKAENYTDVTANHSSAAKHSFYTTCEGQKYQGEQKGKPLITIALSCFAFLLICVLFAYPGPIYEELNTFVNDTESLYLQSDSTASEVFDEKENGMQAWARSIWSSIQENDDNIDPENNALHLIDSEETLTNEVWEKIDVTKEIFNTRASEVCTQLENQVRGTVTNVCYQDFITNYGNDPDAVFGNITVNCKTKQLSTADALRLLSLYNALYPGDSVNEEVGDYKAWLGYEDPENSKSLSIDVKGKTFNISSWSGTFLPPYLLSEQKQNPEGDYSAFQCAAVDLILKIASSDLSSACGIESTIEEYKCIYSISAEEMYSHLEDGTWEEYLETVKKEYNFDETTDKIEESDDISNDYPGCYCTNILRAEYKTQIDYTFNLTVRATNIADFVKSIGLVL